MAELKVLYEDNHVIVAVKPPMMPSQADSSGDMDMLSAVKSYVKEKYNKPGEVYIGLVHRLDRPVGGVMVFARTSKAASRLSEQVKSRSIGKEYAAIVHGITEEEGSYRDMLFRDEKTNTVSVRDVPGAKEARLSFKRTAVDEKRKLSLVNVKLETGRHHQIRVQMASHGHPIVGDARYGTDGDKGGIRLFSHRIAFIHPTKKELMEFEYIPKFEEDFKR